jgi:serine/threonine protein kinase
MALKRENRPHGKNLHEYKILTEIRNGISPLFAKYFIPVNAPGYNLNEKPLLMMEFLADGTLIEYMRNRKKSVSLISKAYLLFSVTMALRYLEAYRIVHLDVKPNNIMIAQGLLVKLIDFG